MLRRTVLPSVVLGSLLLTATPAHATPPDPDPWWGTDKALHMGACAGFTGGGYAIATTFTDDIAGRAAMAASFGIGAGLGKEVVDTMGFGTPSWKDFLWDVIGTGIGVSVSITIDLGVRAAQSR